MVVPLDTPLPSLTISLFEGCPVGPGKSLLPGGSLCKYKGGGVVWNWEVNCNDVGYENIMCERDGLNPSVFNQVSKDVCMNALANMQDMNVNVLFDKNSCPINLKDKPPGYYITCNDSGEMIGQFNEKAWNSIKNKWNEAEPLCANPSWT